MTREIKFRAKAIHDGRWVYGLPRIRDGIEHVIIEDSTGLGEDADKETLGQFTGLLDKNGKEIYESDIVSIYDPYIETQDGVPIAELPENKLEVVEWKDGAWIIGDELAWEEASNCEVFGNVHQNLELL